jgi:hypothetical protein
MLILHKKQLLAVSTFFTDHRLTVSHVGGPLGYSTLKARLAVPDTSQRFYRFRRWDRIKIEMRFGVKWVI